MGQTTLKAPELLGEDVILEKYRKRIVNRRFSDGEFIVWGGTSVPYIVFAVTDKSEIVLVRQFRRGANGFVLELPGGLPEPGQTLEETVRAELSQETGYVPVDVMQLGPPMWFEPASCTTPFIPVLALGCRKVAEQELDPTEVMSVVLMSPAEWLTHCAYGTGRDAKSLALTLLAFPRLGFEFRLPNSGRIW